MVFYNVLPPHSSADEQRSLFHLKHSLAFFFYCNDVIVILGTLTNIYVDDEFKVQKNKNPFVFRRKTEINYASLLSIPGLKSLLLYFLIHSREEYQSKCCIYAHSHFTAAPVTVN